MVYKLFLVFVFIFPCGAVFAERPASESKPTAVKNNPNIDFAAFIKLAKRLESVRAERRVPLERFLKMAKEPNTILLDTRSKSAFEAVHLEGAVHLNFSDFTDQKLAKTIPSKKTRILIYCNNNFSLPRLSASNLLNPNANTVEKDGEEEIIAATTLKRPSLALNIPTFINLWGYGYENVYELADSVPIYEPELPLAGSGLATEQVQKKTKR
ncbi:MAG: rhodanese-like domain-containing protein [Planctomycetota bacterium]